MRLNIKKKLLILTLFQVLILHAISQRSDSSTSIPNYQLREAVRLIEVGKIDSAIIVKQDSIISGQKRIIVNKNTQLSIYLEKLKTYDNLVTAYKSQIAQLNKAGTISDDWVKALRKEVKQQRTQKTVIGILAILGIGTTIYLFAK